MRPPRYHGDAEAYLRAFAIFARAHPDLGLQCARAFERLVEDLIAADDVRDLERRDLWRQLEELEQHVRYLFFPRNNRRRRSTQPQEMNAMLKHVPVIS